jgi:hypothetical protein
MKTNAHEGYKTHEPSQGRWEMQLVSSFFSRALRGCFVLGMFGLAVLLSLPLTSVQAFAGDCSRTSRVAWESCRQGAWSDYWLAIGKCDNLPTDEQQACRRQADADKRSAFQDCTAQFQVRQDVCKALGGGPYDPDLSHFSNPTTINNPYFPLIAGTTFKYQGEEPDKPNEVDVMEVTSATQQIANVTCVVVHDTVTVNGIKAEETYDYYAQDDQGNVWYFGENSMEFDPSGTFVVSVEGSWIAGEDGAKPGIIMEASSKVGDEYRQEFALSVAEDMAQVLSLDEPAVAPLNTTYPHCLKTQEFSALEPDALEYKYYVSGVGNVQVVDAATGLHLDLVSVVGP